ncbi:hypothetical protein WSK_2915 [Novosphingobium sp. Rr 2-17]|uniref:outer membrane beta-barrel protein n=1 Tax=Novosphingobium sp. Rr 2-17 TaxID=555793 RepID=UPI000269A1FF|nr:outer membrane beta-barrel protein [Novosphingobium sp. Rr 2-17]EIZ78471.1 hypothetical protein WSK_2915 [Novosphingobium sp. Rr 2-17]
MNGEHYGASWYAAAGSWMGLVVLACLASPAFGQTMAVPDGTGVLDRPRPEFAPIGGRIGSFFLFPRFDLSAEGTDNLRATKDDRIADVELGAAGKIAVQSNFSRHALALSADYARTVHVETPSENTSRYGARADGRFDFERGTWLAASGSAEHGFEPRSSYNSLSAAARPGRYDQLAGTVAAERTSGRVTLGASAAVTTLRYDDVALTSGSVRSQRYRNLNLYLVDAMAGYEFRPGIKAIGRVTVSKTNYTLAATSPLQPSGLDRDSKGVRIEGGLRFELTSLLVGEARAGYLTRDYADPRLRDTSGFSFGADVLWNVTQMTSLRLKAQRRIDEAASVNIAGYRVTEFALTADHELRRNLIVSAGVRQATLSPLGPQDDSHEFAADVAARLLMSRRVSMRVNYRHAQRTSPQGGNSYRENRLGATLRLTF